MSKHLKDRPQERDEDCMIALLRTGYYFYSAYHGMTRESKHTAYVFKHKKQRSRWRPAAFRRDLLLVMAPLTAQVGVITSCANHIFLPLPQTL